MPKCGCCKGSYPCYFCESGFCLECFQTFRYDSVKDYKSFVFLVEIFGLSNCLALVEKGIASWEEHEKRNPDKLFAEKLRRERRGLSKIRVLVKKYGLKMR